MMINGKIKMSWQLRWRQSGGKQNRFVRKEKDDYKKRSKGKPLKNKDQRHRWME